MTPPTFCRSCEERLFGPEPEDGLCAECRHDVAVAEAWLADREAHEQRAAERAQATEAAPVMSDEIPW